MLFGAGFVFITQKVEGILKAANAKIADENTSVMDSIKRSG